jgi:hypothetical protein
VDSPITVVFHSQISSKQITYNNVNPGTLLAVIKGSKSKPAKELADRLIPILEDLAH